MSDELVDYGESAYPVYLDRTRLYAIEQEEQRHQERQALDHVAHYQALGVGLAAMCQVFYATMIADTRFTHAEVVSLMQAMVQGR